MCGISGILNVNGFQSCEIKNMTDIIRHRGPDDEGFFIEFDFQKEYEVLGGEDTPFSVLEACLNYTPKKRFEPGKSIAKLAFGHRRLSILDLTATGHQPMSFNNDNYWLVFNGEVYNYIEIKTELEDLGYQFRTNSDTEVIIAAFDCWGDDCQNKFIGMWAFAIYDRKKEILFLSRDRFGIKPLYYWISPSGSFHFASEIKQFSVLSEWEAKLNHQRASDYLLYDGLTDHTNETLFKGVYQIEQGCSAVIKLNEVNYKPGELIETKRWYKPQSIKFKGTFDEARDIFKQKLFDSVKLHLRADVTVGSALSGGLDSSSIVCIINEMLRKEDKNDLQNTFSSVHRDPLYSEKQWVDQIVEFTGVNANFIYPQPEEMFELTEKILWHMDEPYQSQSAFLGYQIFRNSKQNDSIVLLNGQGADEYLSGYGAFRAIRRRELSLKNLFYEFNTLGGYSAKSLIPILKWKAYDWFSTQPAHIKSNILKFKRSHRNLNKIIDKSYLRSRDCYPYISTNFKKHTEVSNFQLYVDALPRYLRWEDRNSMAHSVEARVPFLDHRLVEFCHSLPVDFLDNKDNSKLLLVEAMKGVLPEIVRKRKDKKGFLTPEERWVKQDFTKQFRTMMTESINLSKGILKADALDYFDKVSNGKEQFDYTYWRLILFGLWMKVYNVKI